MIQVKSPTRVDFSGGTLDCWPLYLLVGNCKTLNLSIDIYTGVELEPRSSSEIHMIVHDLHYDKKFADLNEFLTCGDNELTLVKPHIEYWKPEKGFKLKTFSQSPVGGGLGGSSSLCVSLLKAFSQWLDRPIDTYEMVKVASNIEAKILKTPTGTQDYFPAIEPGLNVIHYGVEGCRLERLDVDLSRLAKRLLLVYTGCAHHSGINNWQVLKSAIEGDEKTIASLKKIAEISEQAVTLSRNEDWDGLGKVFKEEYLARTELCEAFSSPEIVQLNDLVLSHGADALKICGAGGGGCVLVLSPEDAKANISKACKDKGFKVFDIQPVGQG